MAATALLSSGCWSTANFDSFAVEEGSDASDDAVSDAFFAEDTISDARSEALHDIREDASGEVPRSDVSDVAEVSTDVAEVSTETSGGDSSAEVEAETPEPLNRCKGKGIETGHVVILFNTPKSLPSGYPTFAGAVDATTLTNPYPGCSSPTSFPGGSKTYRCDFGILAPSSVVRFLIGPAMTSGDSIKPPYYSRVDGGKFSADGEIIACKGEVEIGSYTSASGFLGQLRQWGMSEKFELSSK